MAFGLNRVELIGRLGADVTVNHLTSGGRVANLSIATDESYINRQSGEKVDKTEWHRVVTFQDGLIDMFVKHAVKGRLVYIDGKLQTRRWSKPDEDGDRFSTEILLVPGGRVQFLDKPNGNGAPAQADPAMAGDTGAPLRRISTSLVGNPFLDGPSSFRFLPPHWGRRFGVGPFFLQPIRSETRSGAAPALRSARTPSGAGGGGGRPVSGVPHGLEGVPHASRTVSRRRHRRRARPAGRSRLPALPAARPQAGPLLDRWGYRRRPRAVALRPPPRSRRAGEMDRRRDRAARRPARPHPPSRERADAARGARRGAGLPCPAGFTGDGLGQLF